ncbi:MAG: flagellar filament outer layer protein FlaA [Spirochaetaceae bacterium]|jgi:hypothetical protein|nr:flagellar filament outer layer protein FlaA [Spirochaetaceae bacterium]
MKRILVFVSVMFAASIVFADESVLVDFTKLVPDILEGQEDQGVLPQNKQTLMDFSGGAGTTYTNEQKAAMKTSLAIPNWNVRLAQSSQSVVNDNLSYTKVTTSKQFTNVLGARIHFPVASYNAWAKIAPPFDIPAYDFAVPNDDGTLAAPAEKPNFNTGKSRFEDGYGVVKNVGAIKSFAVQVYGLNFPCTLSLIVIDGLGQEKSISMGSLNYDGWAQLTWNNPQYIQDVRNRSIRMYPLYPSYAPYIRFGGFVIQRDGANAQIVNGDLVAYFKEVRIIYDKAELDIENRDIDDEGTWDIISEREASRASTEAKGFGRDLVGRYLEKQKEAQETAFTDPLAGEGGGQAQGGGGAAAPAAQ